MVIKPDYLYAFTIDFPVCLKAKPNQGMALYEKTMMENK